MLCDQAGELLSAYLDGELPSQEALFLEKHLRACPACTGRLGELRQVRAVLASLEAVVPPARFHADLHQRLVAAAPVRGGRVVAIGRKSIWRPASRWVAAAAAAAVMAVSAGSYYMQIANTRPNEIAVADGVGTDSNVTVSPAPGDSTSTPVVPKPVVPALTAPTPAKSNGNSGSDQGAAQSGSQSESATAVGNTSAPSKTPAGSSDNGVKPPEPSRNDGVNMAEQHPTTGVSQPVATSTPAPPAVQGPFLIYRAQISLQAKADDATWLRLVTISQDFNGTFNSLGVFPQANGERITKVILRVPNDKYKDAKARILAIAPSLSVTEIGPTDVTAQINLLQQQMAELIQESTQLKGAQLDSAQRDIAAKQADLANYYDQARLATIEVSIVE